MGDVLARELVQPRLFVQFARRHPEGGAGVPLAHEHQQFIALAHRFDDGLDFVGREFHDRLLGRRGCRTKWIGPVVKEYVPHVAQVSTRPRRRSGGFAKPLPHGMPTMPGALSGVDIYHKSNRAHSPTIRIAAHRTIARIGPRRHAGTYDRLAFAPPHARECIMPLCERQRLRGRLAQDRSLHCRSIGGMPPDGDVSLKVASRTLVMNQASAGIHGVVFDSKAALEWRQCQWKSLGAGRCSCRRIGMSAPGRTARICARLAAMRERRRRRRAAQCFASICFGFGGAGTFAYWNAGVAFNASLVAPEVDVAVAHVERGDRHRDIMRRDAEEAPR